MTEVSRSINQHQPEAQFRFFISNVNSIIGQALVEMLRNDNENDVNPHIIVGTLNKDDPTPCCRGVKKIIDASDTRTLLRVILDSDIIIFDVQNTNIDEMMFSLKALTSLNYTSNKLFILISSILTWSGTPPKDQDGENLENVDNMSVTTGKYSSPNNPEMSSDGTMINSMYSESEYASRKAIPAYQNMKNLENAVLTANKCKETLRTYVLCSGITYGNGEESFYKLFDTAYQAKDDLKIFGDGKNIIPMIHVNDLAVYVKLLVYKRPDDIEYILALDHSKNRSQGALIRAISSGMGQVPVRNVSFLDAVFEPDFNLMTMNIPVIPSNL